MKTTIELSDDLFLRAKVLAKKEHTTLRELTEEGLSNILALREARRTPKIRPVTFKGKGLSPGFEEAPWSTIRDVSYGLDRG